MKLITNYLKAGQVNTVFFDIVSTACHQTTFASLSVATGNIYISQSSSLTSHNVCLAYILQPNLQPSIWAERHYCTNKIHAISKFTACFFSDQIFYSLWLYFSYSMVILQHEILKIVLIFASLSRKRRCFFKTIKSITYPLCWNLILINLWMFCHTIIEK